MTMWPFDLWHSNYFMQCTIQCHVSCKCFGAKEILLLVCTSWPNAVFLVIRPFNFDLDLWFHKSPRFYISGPSKYAQHVLSPPALWFRTNNSISRNTSSYRFGQVWPFVLIWSRDHWRWCLLHLHIYFVSKTPP